jgi:hypothetical protein
MIVPLAALIVLTTIATVQNTSPGASAEECAAELPLFAETCRTVGALLQRVDSGFGGGSNARQVFSTLLLEDRAPRDTSKLEQLPLLRWDRRATGFATSIPSGTCWLESAGAIMRCGFDFGADAGRSADRYEELRAVLHMLAPATWRTTASPVSVLFSDGTAVRAAVHRVNFGAADWVADSPMPRWKVLLSLGRLGTHDEVPAAAWQ